MLDELYVCSKQVIHQVYLSLGANIGNRKRTIRQAVELIGAQVGDMVRQSSLYETEPWGFSSPNKFINACVCCHTVLTPREVLVVTQRIELTLGRLSKSVGDEYHDRIIDIDILLYDDLIINEPELQVPHPHMHEREFVLRPLQEIMGE